MKRINWLWTLGIVLLLIIISWITLYKINSTKPVGSASHPVFEVSHLEPKIMKYGFDLDFFLVDSGVIKRNQFVSEILSNAGISHQTIFELANKAEEVIHNGEKVASTKRIREGKNYALVFGESCEVPEYMVYEPNVYRYVVYGLKDSVTIEVHERPVEKVLEFAEGTINSSLWDAMLQTGVTDQLISKMEQALGGVVSFYHVHKGDTYKAIFEKEIIDGKPVGIGKLIGAYFNTLNTPYYAIYYESSKYHGFYDLEGRTMLRRFLKAPVQFTRISSRYNRRRFHPIRRRTIPHLGTDYAAPYGTPIYAVADGTIILASYTKGNGNFVKIRHDKVYQTQYLHMSRFAKGIRAGVRVRQGETIGYVGSTGLATGPHVCFRFWKNGRQINHLNLNFPPPDPMDSVELPAFYAVRDKVVDQLNEGSVELLSARANISSQQVSDEP